MKKLLFLSSLFLFGFIVNAQPEDFKKVEAYKTKFITDELDLSPEEAQKFWPVYNEYNKKLNELHQKRMEGMSRREVHDKWDELDDATLEKIALEELQNQKKIAELKLEYYDKFKAALGSRKAATFYRIEIEFHRRLMESLGRRRGRP
ncbi:hypothetical protein [Croceimicrobium hydrocarbonivorans]|uniref:Sensor of ECF-type sigma factor n=1 Tax=Croceimicrobium hydrocarbonivorans TaxID=2761580 RepID=A0A7H0VCS9_9FLAO|nr:hypothetical protein [Croceimicrobium hydrocarbonivorans]QNR23527.1 hypothetical protein H4K34_14235 [Croceimicrobium hydrocarbonivorans]